MLSTLNTLGGVNEHPIYHLTVLGSEVRRARTPKAGILRRWSGHGQFSLIREKNDKSADKSENEHQKAPKSTPPSGHRVLQDQSKGLLNVLSHSHAPTHSHSLPLTPAHSRSSHLKSLEMAQLDTVDAFLNSNLIELAYVMYHSCFTNRIAHMSWVKTIVQYFLL